jgi:metallo-beta-lactamase family protein
MDIEFSGAAGEVTGSCHIVRVGTKTILLDCGLFQGRRRETEGKNRKLPLPIEQIDAVILSHAHIDHAGRLPYLVANGYRGPIWCTPATRDLSALMLADSAHIQQKDAEFLARERGERVEPLYTTANAAAAVARMRSVPYGETFQVAEGVSARFTDAGHILGSASVVLDCVEQGRNLRLVFSGDIGRSGQPIIRDPQPPEGGADAVIMESTYGNRDHPAAGESRQRLAAVIAGVAKRGGRVLVPAFAVGRTQELLYELHSMSRSGEIPKVPIFIDSPLAIDATGVYAAHPDVFDRDEDLVRVVEDLFTFDLVRYTRDAADSKKLNGLRVPMVVIAASGMAESGRIVHHLRNGLGDSRNVVLIVGFQAEHTLGRRLVEKRPMVRIFGEEFQVRAGIEVLNGFSAHADRGELRRWIDAVAREGDRGRRPKVFLVHGEAGARESFSAELTAGGYEVKSPGAGDHAEL